MLRKLLKLLLALAALGGVVLGVLVWNINPLLESLRPRLQSILSDKLQKPVKFSRLIFRFVPTLGIELHDLTLEEAGAADGTRVERVLLETELGPLFVGDFRVQKLEVHGADLRVARSEQGELSLGGVPLAKSQPPKPPQESEPAPASKEGKVSFAVTEAKVRDSRFSFVDRSVAPAQEIAFEKISADLKDIHANGVKRFELSAGVLGGANNFIVDGSAERSGVLPSGKIRLRGKALDLARIGALLLAYKKLPPELALQRHASFTVETDLQAGTFSANVDAEDAEIMYGSVFKKASGTPAVLDAAGSAGLTGAVKLDKALWRLGELAFDTPLTVEPGGLTTIALQTTSFPLTGVPALFPAAAAYRPRGSVEATLSAAIEKSNRPKLLGTVQLKDVAASVPMHAEKPESPPLEVSGVNGKIELSEQAVSAKPLTLLVGEQKIDVGLRYTLAAPAMLQVAAKGTDMDLAPLLAATNSTDKVSMTGTLSSLKVQLSGPADGFAAAATGSISAEAVKGTIEGFNLLAQTLSKADKIPGLGATLLSFVDEKHRPLLQQNSTPFDRLAVNAALNGKNISLRNVTLEHSLYGLTGQGELPANGELSVDAQLRLSEALTGGMVEKEDKLKLLLDANRNMVIPVIVRKKGGVFVVLPDFTDLGKRAFSNKAKDAASKALDKVAPGLGGAIDSLFK